MKRVKKNKAEGSVAVLAREMKFVLQSGWSQILRHHTHTHTITLVFFDLTMTKRLCRKLWGCYKLFLIISLLVSLSACCESQFRVPGRLECVHLLSLSVLFICVSICLIVVYLYIVSVSV